MTTLEETYEELRRHNQREPYSQATFELVYRLVAEFGEEGIADRILDETPQGFPWEETARILAIMIWTTSDNGAQISRDSERWIRKLDDERRAFVALHLDFYPFLEASEMESALTRLGQRFPALSGRCHSMIESRNQHAEHVEGGKASPATS